MAVTWTNFVMNWFWKVAAGITVHILASDGHRMPFETPFINRSVCMPVNLLANRAKRFTQQLFHFFNRISRRKHKKSCLLRLWQDDADLPWSHHIIGINCLLMGPGPSDKISMMGQVSGGFLWFLSGFILYAGCLSLKSRMSYLLNICIGRGINHFRGIVFMVI